MPPWLARDLVGAGDVRLGDDEHVHRRLGGDVVERVGPLALGDGLETGPRPRRSGRTGSHSCAALIITHRAARRARNPSPRRRRATSDAGDDGRGLGAQHRRPERQPAAARRPLPVAHPPSGPTATRGARRPSRRRRSGRATATSPGTSPTRTGSSTTRSWVRRHWPAASAATRRQRASVLARASPSKRTASAAHTSGTTRATPELGRLGHRPLGALALAPGAR